MLRSHPRCIDRLTVLCPHVCSEDVSFFSTLGREIVSGKRLPWDWQEKFRTLGLFEATLQWKCWTRDIVNLFEIRLHNARILEAIRASEGSYLRASHVYKALTEYWC